MPLACLVSPGSLALAGHFLTGETEPDLAMRGPIVCALDVYRNVQTSLGMFGKLVMFKIAFPGDGILTNLPVFN